MTEINNISIEFENGLGKLGLNRSDDSLFLVNEKREFSDPQIEFHLEKAYEFHASAIYLRKLLNGSYKPQVYLFDFTDQRLNTDSDKEIALIQKKIWSSGEAPLACFFYNTEIKIVNCTTHLNPNSFKPVYLVEHLKIAGKAHELYNSQFAIKWKKRSN